MCATLCLQEVAKGRLGLQELSMKGNCTLAETSKTYKQPMGLCDGSSSFERTVMCEPQVAGSAQVLSEHRERHVLCRTI